ncbi:MAG: glycosyltransferase family 2 protein, partial [Thermoprotei archaeon]
MSSPYISIIVTAYNRKKYLLSAVKSVLDQTLPRDHYEVIVIKNFRDDFIDSKLKEWGVTNLYSESVGLGAKIYEALQVARGDVISFLDDDDE